MDKQQRLPYLPAMFATCMLFQSLYVLCVLWFTAPGLPGHAALTGLFPGFQLLDVPGFIWAHRQRRLWMGCFGYLRLLLQSMAELRIGGVWPQNGNAVTP